MAIVINDNEVILNGVRYPLTGKVRPSLASVMPEKTVIGDYSKDTDPNLSTWAMNDFTGGVLVEHLDESDPAQAKHSWFSILNHKARGSSTLPYLINSATKPSRTATTWEDGTNHVVDGGGNQTWTNPTNMFDGDTGTAATAILNVGQSTEICYMYFPVMQCSQIRFWWNSTNPQVGDTVVIGVYYDGTWNNHSQVTPTTGAYVTVALGATKTVYAIRVSVASQLAATVSMFEVQAYPTDTTMGTFLEWANFNSNLYYAQENWIGKWNTSTLQFDVLWANLTTITALVPEINDTMLVYVGDTVNYWYMSTAEAFAQTDVTDATLGIIWDDKAWKMDNDGNFSYTVTPNAASPSWTANGVLDLPAGYAKRLKVYRDADGNAVIYVSTKSGLYVHDFANAKFLKSEVILPEQNDSGKGLDVWHSSLYVSSGLNFYQYTAGQVADITDVGLHNFDGLPIGYSGAIVDAIQSYDEIFVLVSGPSVNSTQYSSVMSYDNKGWHVWYTVGTNKTMYRGIVSTVTDNRFWFTTTDGIFWIELPIGSLNPKKITTTTYDSSGFCFTPWFDAGWANGSKIADELFVKTSSCTVDQDVIVQYRTDYSYNDLSSGLTTLGIIESNGITTYSFGSGAGIAFKAIQFAFTLRRGGGNTNSPVLEWFALKYTKRLEPAWSYQFTIDCTQPYNHKSTSQLVDAIKTASESTTKIALSFRNDYGGTETYYGIVTNVLGDVQTGIRKEGQFTVTVFVP